MSCASLDHTSNGYMYSLDVPVDCFSERNGITLHLFNKDNNMLFENVFDRNNFNNNKTILTTTAILQIYSSMLPDPFNIALTGGLVEDVRTGSLLCGSRYLCPVPALMAGWVGKFGIFFWASEKEVRREQLQCVSETDSKLTSRRFRLGCHDHQAYLA